MSNEKNRKKILLFIPGYNCEKQIIRVLNQLDQEIMTFVSEVLVINNQSTDNTERAVMTWMKDHKEIPFVLLRNDDNYGLGGSHKVAFQYALKHHYEYALVLHGDDQGEIHDILPVIRSGKYKAYDCCLGARFMKGSERMGYSGFRTFGNMVYNRLFSLGCRYEVKDLGSGLNLYRVTMLKSGYYMKYPDNLMFNYCMVMAVRYYRQNVMFFPISWREDDQVSNVKLLNQAKKVMTMLGCFVRNPKVFMKSEMRERPVSAYTAQIMYRNTVNQDEKQTI